METLSKRILFVAANCPHCGKYLSVLPRINAELEPERRIRIVDVADLDPVVDSFRKLLREHGTPLLYLGGVVISGMTTEEFAEGFLKGFLKERGEMA